jgi:hypothetical protein
MRRGLRLLALLALALGAFWLTEIGLLGSTAGRGTALNTRADLEIDYLLSPASVRALGGPLGEDFDVTGASVAIVSAGDRLYAVDRSSASEIPLKGVAPSSFAVDTNDTLLTISGGYLGLLDEHNDALHAIPLQSLADARLARSSNPGTFFVFGGAAGSYRLYRFRDDGTLEILLDLPERIVAVTDTSSTIYVATAAHILRLDANGPVLLFKAPAGWTPIVSLSVPASGRPVFFSTDTKVFVLLSGGAVSIINDSGGTLRLRGDTMYVLDRRRLLLYAAHPVSEELLKVKG